MIALPFSGGPLASTKSKTSLSIGKISDFPNPVGKTLTRISLNMQQLRLPTFAQLLSQTRRVISFS